MGLARFAITLLDTGANVKVEEYDPTSDGKNAINATLIMGNQGRDPREFVASGSRAYLITVSDASSGPDDLIYNPDPQQNMRVYKREDVAPVDQSQHNVSNTDGSSKLNLATGDELTPVGGTIVKDEGTFVKTETGEQKVADAAPVPPVQTAPAAMVPETEVKPQAPAGDQTGEKPAEKAAAVSEQDAVAAARAKLAQK